MKLARWKTVAGGWFLAALLSVPAWGADYADSRRTASPGALNYVEGQASMGDQNVDSKSVGSAALQNGEVLATGNGKAEILLTPGVYLRLGSNSSVKMVSSGLTNTQVSLDQGEAMVEVDQIVPGNHLVVTDHNANVQLDKKGLYSFNADQPMVAVYDGKASVQVGDKSADVGKGKELALQPADKLKTQSFNREQEGELYAWSSMRSQYLSEANGYSAQTILAGNPGWWYGTGWYWNPYFDTWAFVPGAGYLYSPFGFGFFSPGYAYYGGFYGHGFYRGYPGRVGVYHGGPAVVGGFHGGAGGFHGGFAGGGFHGGGGRR